MIRHQCLRRALLALSAFLCTAAGAQPTTLRFQGRLTDSRGFPITGQPLVRFELFDAAAGGARVWGPSPDLAVASNEAGLFAVDIDLGASAADVFSAASELFLQVTVKAGTGGQDQVLSPRQRLSGVPYAFAALSASSATVAATVPDHSLTPAKMDAAAFAGAGWSIPSGAILLFSGACPAGYDEATALKNSLPGVTFCRKR